MSDETPEPTLEEVFAQYLDGMLDGIRVSMPGRIESYNKDTQSATVQPLIMDGELDEQGVRITKTIAAINDVPVFFMGGKRSRITYPVTPGDYCDLRFCSSAISRWVKSGGIVDPGDDRRHDISDAIAYVGLHTFGAPPTDAPLDAFVIHVDDATLIKLGGSSGTQKTMMIDNWETAFNSVISAIAAIPGGSGVTGAWTTFKTVANRKTTKTEVK